ncbi:hypothetical protein SBOR_9335 [Sclerotinia borealis F-4128]|uniref:Uncharacterized protein n=1 Tax=Sclerotinia borealis (strain F-4128) TaxID=1432307 RepID=W9C6T4_SCLBF|nr:hypothetical protein SBOR_9335 [Sclerotinia borealis F-4128]
MAENQNPTASSSTSPPQLSFDKEISARIDEIDTALQEIEAELDKIPDSTERMLGHVRSSLLRSTHMFSAILLDYAKMDSDNRSKCHKSTFEIERLHSLVKDRFAEVNRFRV